MTAKTYARLAAQFLPLWPCCNWPEPRAAGRIACIVAAGLAWLGFAAYGPERRRFVSSEEKAMAHVLVMGASCGIGLETVKPGLRAGHSVRALARSAASIAIQDAALENVSGDALDSDMIRDALQGIDAAIQTLGIDISPPGHF